MAEKDVQINEVVETKEVTETKEVKENTADDYYEAESRQFSGCGD